MPEKKFELGDYVEVKDRLKLFYELYGKGSIVTEEVTLTTEPDGKPRVMVRAAAFRTPEDPHPGIGYSWLELPGSTPYTKGSEVENAETSAWGRAIASLGILVDRSIASAQEVQNKAGDAPERPAVAQEQAFLPDGGLIGTAHIQGTQDGQLRQSPNGWTLPFRVKNGKSYIVVAENELAEALAAIWSEVKGSRVTVWGRWSDETIPAKGTKPAIHYRILHLERIQTPDVTLPGWVDAPPDDVPLLDEAPSVPLGLVG